MRRRLFWQIAVTSPPSRVHRGRSGHVCRLSCPALCGRTSLVEAGNGGPGLRASAWPAPGPPTAAPHVLARYLPRVERAVGSAGFGHSPSGKVIADSGEDPAVLDNHRERPEVVQVLAGGTGRSIRAQRQPAGSVSCIWRCPCEREGRIVAIVRASQPAAPLAAAYVSMYVEIAAVLACWRCSLITGGTLLAVAAVGSRPQRDPPRRRASRPRPVEVSSTGRPFGGNRHVG